jgi:serine/threonine-protein kinase
MSMWSRLRRAFGAPPPLEPPDEAPGPPAEETYLRDLLTRIGDVHNTTAQAAVGDREFWAAVQRLLAGGRERTAIELLARFVTARPNDAPLAARLAEILCDRQDDTSARPLLERLLSSPPHALRARLLLAEAAERAGDDDGARRHFEAILAVDLDYPKARAGADRLRRAVAAAPIVEVAATLAGLPEGGAGFGGRYRLLRELGRGGAGAVYVARDEELDRELALKILHPHARAEARAEARARAWNEARIAAAIRHPGVVAIYDLDEERQLLAMELCAGGALKAEVARGPLPVDDALARAAELCATLDAVHRRGVVHGDVKPANLLFRDDRALVLGDFGVARLIGDKPLVDERNARGTLAYMAPEQRRGEPGPPADVYAAGVILVELLHGTGALAGWLGDRVALLRGTARWDGRLPAPVTSALGEERAARLTALVHSLLSDSPDTRPTAAAAALALQALRLPT